MWGNPVNFRDPLGLTQQDINAALNAANKMQPQWIFPSSVKTWSQDGKAGKHYFWDSDVYVDAKYLECLDDGTALALLNTLLHELTHYNQTWHQFAIDNIRERITSGNSSDAENNAGSLIWKNDKVVTDYLNNRDKDCECKK